MIGPGILMATLVTAAAVLTGVAPVFSMPSNLASLESAGASDQADVARIKAAYQSRPRQYELSHYHARLFWRDEAAGGKMSALWMWAYGGVQGDYLIIKDKVPKVFDGGCDVVHAQPVGEASVAFTCNQR